MCQFSGCVKPMWATGLCSGHYAQHRKGQELEPLGVKRKISTTPKREVVNGKLPCSQCLNWLDVDEFSCDNSTSSGKRSWCRECHSKKTRKAKYGDVAPALNCDLCGSEGKLVVDHDHSCCPGTFTCGKCIRGWLCHGCNTGLGKLGDSVESLERAIQYLMKSKNLLDLRS